MSIDKWAPERCVVFALTSITYHCIILTMKITTKGQVTIPLNLRNRFGLLPNTEVIFTAIEEGVLIKPSKNRRELYKERLAKATGSATVSTTTEGIMRITRDQN